MRDSMVFYRSFKAAIDRLPEDEQLSAYRAITGYALDDDEAEGVAGALLEAFKPLIDSNNRKFENGKKGGRPRIKPEGNHQETTTKPNQNQTQTKPNLNEKCEMLNENGERRKAYKRARAKTFDYEDQRPYTPEDFREMEKAMRGRS